MIDWYHVTISVGGYALGMATALLGVSLGQYMAGVSQSYSRPAPRDWALDKLGEIDPPRTTTTHPRRYIVLPARSRRDDGAA